MPTKHNTPETNGISSLQLAESHLMVSEKIIILKETYAKCNQFKEMQDCSKTISKKSASLTEAVSQVYRSQCYNVHLFIKRSSWKGYWQ